jgi:hypothetical protein
MGGAGQRDPSHTGTVSEHCSAGLLDDYRGELIFSSDHDVDAFVLGADIAAGVRACLVDERSTVCRLADRR